MRRVMTGILALAILCTIPAALGQEAAEPYVPDQPWESIDVAILFDTSGSMQKVLDAARLKIWEIVNDLALAEPTPHVRVSILTYGHTPRGPEDGWVRIWAPLTDSLDLVSQRLFEARIQGDKEYVGRALDAALQDLEWTESEEALRLVFLVGNERADQDLDTKLEDIIGDAVQKGVILNAIYCGSHRQPAAKSWKQIADLGNGQFATIDHKRDVSLVKSPYDKQLVDLGDAYNKTYLPIGPRGRQGWTNQAEQDSNAKSLTLAGAATRVEAKASPLYNASWDLLDMLASGNLSLAEVAVDDLPEEMQQMGDEERELFVNQMIEQRRALKKEIQGLAAQRRLFVSEQRKGKGIDDSWAFDHAIRKALRAQAEKKGFAFPENQD